MIEKIRLIETQVLNNKYELNLQHERSNPKLFKDYFITDEDLFKNVREAYDNVVHLPYENKAVRDFVDIVGDAIANFDKGVR